jgi:hypothetical protein
MEISGLWVRHKAYARRIASFFLSLPELPVLYLLYPFHICNKRILYKIVCGCRVGGLYMHTFLNSRCRHLSASTGQTARDRFASWCRCHGGSRIVPYFVYNLSSMDALMASFLCRRL